MVPPHCLGPDVDPARISPDAHVTGCSYLTGPHTTVAAGAIVHDSRLHDATVAEGAVVADTILMQEGAAARFACDAAGRVRVDGPARPAVGRASRVSGCTFVNAAIGCDGHVVDTWARDCRLGDGNDIAGAKLAGVQTGRAVTIAGPTEVSGAHVGHHATFDQRGYLEGVFSNQFLQLRFDPATGRAVVAGTIDLPHVSRYGFNTVNSTNSGRIRAQPDDVVRGFGPHVGRWHDAMLSHEYLRLDPCCWVTPWTKVVGQSRQVHADDEAMVNDALFTYVMPFAVAGFGGELTQALVMPGELSTGFGPKSRRGAWSFTYAPDAVIRMVGRLWEKLPPQRKAIADTIVMEAIESAGALTRAMAARRDIDLDVPPARQRPGWPRWVAATWQLLTIHREAELWDFRDGQPLAWRERDGRWHHPRIDRLLAVAPDALACQVSEADLFAATDPVAPVSVALPAGALAGTGGPAQIEPGATVADDARVGPGCRVDAGSVIASGARVWNSVIEASTVGQGAVVERCVLRSSAVGAGTRARSSRLTDASVGAASTVDAAALNRATIAAHATINAFADLVDAVTEHASILGGTMHGARADCFFMLYHMAGGCHHFRTVPTMVSHGGTAVALPAIPMIGGGCVMRGTAAEPVELQGAFIGSNAIIEADTFVGFGSFVLGRLGPHAGLLPFTVSHGEAATHQIGGVLTAMANLVMTHFINWNFQLMGPDRGDAIAALVPSCIASGIAAIDQERQRRAAQQPFDGQGPCGRYRSLPYYSDAQLASGDMVYRKMLETGAWDIRFEGGELRFGCERGRWVERDGSVTWRRSDGATGLSPEGARHTGPGRSPGTPSSQGPEP